MIEDDEKLNDILQPGDTGIGKRLREIRESAGIPVELLAKLLETSKETITHVEQGKQILPIEWAYKLCYFLDINAHWLMFGEELRTKKKTFVYNDLLKHLEVPEVSGVINQQFIFALHTFKDLLTPRHAIQGSR